MKEAAIIDVYHPTGKLLKPCRKMIANQLVRRQGAEWINSNAIRLLVTKEDKKRMRQEALIRDNYTCYICGAKLDPNDPEVTVDHIICRADYSGRGRDSLDNYACCCKRCNNDKGIMDLRTYLAKRKAAFNEL